MTMNAKTYKIEEVLREKGVFVGPAVGTSMQPMLENVRDTIVVRPKTGRLKPLDVALYHRGEQYVLHRVIALTEGGYHIRGDNCYYDETVAEEEVIGVLTEFFQRDKRVLCTDEKYLRYAKRRVRGYKIRLRMHKIKAKIRKIFKKGK